jgi:tRNA(Arg) A34 adenosine deaminase TadA
MVYQSLGMGHVGTVPISPRRSAAPRSAVWQRGEPRDRPGRRWYRPDVPVTPDDERHLRQALVLATESRAAGNHPFGALLVDATGGVVAVAHNSVVVDGDPTGHAETNLVRLAGPQVAGQGLDLTTCTLYTSTEPCAMCAGAIYWAGIGRVVYALAEVDLLAMTGGDHPDNPTLALPCRQVFACGSRPVVVDGPALEDEARLVHVGFWS